MTGASTDSAGQIRANARRPGLLESAATITRSARSHSSRSTAASASSCAAGPCTTSKATTPGTATSSVTCPSTPSASGPTGSYDWARATPPVTTISNCGRTASSSAMSSASVTTVGAGDPDARSPRTAGARHLRGGGAAGRPGRLVRREESRHRPGDPLLPGGAASGPASQRQLVRHPVRHRPARVRTNICCPARPSKSRRIVAADTSGSAAASSTSSRPRSTSSSSSACRRASRDVRPPVLPPPAVSRPPAALAPARRTGAAAPADLRPHA